MSTINLKEVDKVVEKIAAFFKEIKGEDPTDNDLISMKNILMIHYSAPFILMAEHTPRTVVELYLNSASSIKK